MQTFGKMKAIRRINFRSEWEPTFMTSEYVIASLRSHGTTLPRLRSVLAYTVYAPISRAEPVARCAGTQEIEEVELNEPEGWVSIPLRSRNSA